MNNYVSLLILMIVLREIMRKAIFSSVLVGAVFISGCATIVGDKTQLVQIESTPPGADFLVKDEQGKVVAQGKTPQGVTLQKSTGNYFGKKQYEVTLSKEDSKPVTLPLKANANGWYVGGNIIFGGLIGWLIVDPFNGGMYTLHPEKIDANLVTQGSGVQ